MKAQLLGARRLISKCGWVGPLLEPWCRDSRRRPVHHTDEGVQTFSLSGALQLYGGLDAAWELLGRIVSPELARLEEHVGRYSLDELHALEPEDYGPLDAKWWQLQASAGGEYLSFGGWLVQPNRTREDVLRVLTSACLRSARECT